jgi:hypothetical protein
MLINSLTGRLERKREMEREREELTIEELLLCVSRLLRVRFELLPIKNVPKKNIEP